MKMIIKQTNDKVQISWPGVNTTKVKKSFTFCFSIKTYWFSKN